MPGGLPLSTNFLIARLLPAPLLRWKSLLDCRHVMNQHQPHAPLSPKSISKSAQRAGVSGFKVKVNFTVLLRSSFAASLLRRHRCDWQRVTWAARVLVSPCRPGRAGEIRLTLRRESSVRAA